MAKKMPRGLVALSASAIAAVYFSGYVSTQAADARLGQGVGTVPGATNGTTAPASLDLGTTLGAAPSTAPSAASAAAPATGSSAGALGQAGTSSPYQDGTFHGTGTSRRGNVSVAVTVHGGRIANVSVTSATTQYPISRIAALPGQVVARQSVQVDRVTGATYSAQAFQQAVQQALAQAKVPGTPTAATTGQGVQPAAPAQPAFPGQAGPTGRTAQPGASSQSGPPQVAPAAPAPSFSRPPRRAREDEREREGERDFTGTRPRF